LKKKFYFDCYPVPASFFPEPCYIYIYKGSKVCTHLMEFVSNVLPKQPTSVQCHLQCPYKSIQYTHLMKIIEKMSRLCRVGI